MSATGTYKIRPAGRLVLTIGRELIQDPYAAVVELVKNAYDADSPDVNIEFKRTPEQTYPSMGTIYRPVPSTCPTYCSAQMCYITGASSKQVFARESSLANDPDSVQAVPTNFSRGD